MKKFLSLLACGTMLAGFAASSHAQVSIDQVKMGPGNALTLVSAGGLTSPYTVTLPNPGGAANVILSTTNGGTQTINGTVDFTGTVNFTSTPALPLAANQILIGNGASPSVAAASGTLFTVDHTNGNTAIAGSLGVNGVSNFGTAQNVSARFTGAGSSWTGGTFFGGTTATDNDVAVGESGGLAEIGGNNGTLTTWTDLYVNPGGGNVRVGSTTAPTNTLDVTGTLGTTGNASIGGTFTASSAATGSEATISNTLNIGITPIALTLNVNSGSLAPIGLSFNGATGLNPSQMDINGTGNTWGVSSTGRAQFGGGISLSTTTGPIADEIQFLNGTQGSLASASLTSPRTWTLPDETGTLATTTDVANATAAAVILAPAASTRNVITPTADAVALTLKGFTTQTSDLLDLTDNAGNNLATFNTGGISGLTLGNNTGGNKQGILRLYSGSGTLVTIAPSGSILDVNNNFQADGNINANSATGVYQINGTTVLSGTSLGSTVTASSLTSVGTLTSGALGAGFTTVGIAQGGTNSGTALSGTSIMVSNGTAIVQGSINSSATKEFLSQTSSGAPAWGALAAADIPAGSSSYIQNTSSLQAGAQFNIGSNGTIGGAITAGNASGLTNSIGNDGAGSGLATTNIGQVSSTANTAVNIGGGTGTGTTTVTIGGGAATSVVNLGALTTNGVVHTTGGTGTLASSLLVNADVSATAGIAYSKLNLASSIANSDLAVGAVNLAGTDVTGILGAGNGGTGNGFVAFSGPTTSTKTFQLPDASASILTTNAAVTLAQGGTGASLTAAAGGVVYSGASSLAISAAGNSMDVLISGGSGAPTWAPQSSIAAGSAGFIVGGFAGDLIYQSGTNTTAFLSGASTNGSVLTYTSGLPTWTAALPAANGGTGVSNSQTITLTGTGNFTFNTAAGSSVTVPASGTLATTSQLTGFVSTAPATTAANTVVSGADAVVPLTVEAHSATQSGDLQDWSSSTPSVLAKVDASGNISAAASYAINGTVEMSAPGSQNIFVGPSAGNSILTGNTNTAVGWKSLLSVTGGAGNGGSLNVAVGGQALQQNTSGSGNVAIGESSLWANTIGGDNTAVGTQALENSTANFNTAFGQAAFQGVSTGTDNTAIGYAAGFAGTALTAGSWNTMLGDQAQVSSATASNQTAIGYDAIAIADNSVQLGNTNVTLVNTSGALETGDGSAHTGALKITDGSTNVGVIDNLGTTKLNGTVHLPPAAGTLALTSDLSNYLPLAGGTMTGDISTSTHNVTGTGTISATTLDAGVAGSTTGSLILENSTSAANKTAVIQAASQGSSETYTIPDAGAAASFVMSTSGTAGQTITTAATANPALTVNNTTSSTAALNVTGNKAGSDALDVSNASSTTGYGLSVTQSSGTNTSAAIHISTANTATGTPVNDIEGAKWAITSNGHITTSSAIGIESKTESAGPVLTAGTATGSDVAGTISFSSAGGNAATDNCTVSVAFAQPYATGSTPTVVLFPANNNASSANTNILGLYVTSTPTGFTLNFTLPATSTAFTTATWNYIVVQP